MVFTSTLGFSALGCLCDAHDTILASPSQVYCSGMQTDSPKEYVTLVNGDAENFSEVYGYR